MSKSNKRLPIGVFDSGLGGLTVLSPLIERLKHENTVYLGDLAHTPYGDKSPEQIIQFALDGLEFFKTHEIKALVVACNSASAVALDALVSAADCPVFDVVSPGARLAEQVSRSRAVGVVGTLATVKSGAYERELKSIDVTLSVHQSACPTLAPLIEKGEASLDEYISTVRKCVSSLPMHDMDTMILGCTHYPLVKDVFRAVCGDEMRLIDSGDATAEFVAEELADRELLNDSDTMGLHHYYLTSIGDGLDTQRFKRQAERFMGRNIARLETVVIGKQHPKSAKA